MNCVIRVDPPKVNAKKPVATVFAAKDEHETLTNVTGLYFHKVAELPVSEEHKLYEVTGKVLHIVYEFCSENSLKFYWLLEGHQLVEVENI